MSTGAKMDGVGNGAAARASEVSMYEEFADLLNGTLATKSVDLEIIAASNYTYLTVSVDSKIVKDKAESMVNRSKGNLNQLCFDIVTMAIAEAMGPLASFKLQCSGLNWNTAIRPIARMNMTAAEDSAMSVEEICERLRKTPATLTHQERTYPVTANLGYHRDGRYEELVNVVFYISGPHARDQIATINQQVLEGGGLVPVNRTTVGENQVFHSTMYQGLVGKRRFLSHPGMRLCLVGEGDHVQVRARNANEMPVTSILLRLTGSGKLCEVPLKMYDVTRGNESGRRGPARSDPDGTGGGGGPRGPRRCFNCQAEGHLARFCPQRGDSVRVGASSPADGLTTAGSIVREDAGVAVNTDAADSDTTGGESAGVGGGAVALNSAAWPTALEARGLKEQKRQQHQEALRTQQQSQARRRKEANKAAEREKEVRVAAEKEALESAIVEVSQERAKMGLNSSLPVQPSTPPRNLSKRRSEALQYSPDRQRQRMENEHKTPSNSTSTVDNTPVTRPTLTPGSTEERKDGQ